MSPPKFELAVKGADKVFAVEGRLTIGTAPGSTIRLKPEGQLAPNHAVVEVREGALFVQATGPTLVNGVAVTSGELTVGSVLRVGRLDLVVRQVANRGEVITQPEAQPDITDRTPVLSGPRPPPSQARSGAANPVMQAPAARRSGAVPAAPGAARPSGAVTAVPLGDAARRSTPAGPAERKSGAVVAPPAAPAERRSGPTPAATAAPAARRSGAVPAAAAPAVERRSGAVPAAAAPAAERRSGAVPAPTAPGAARRSGAVPAAPPARRSGANLPVPAEARASGALKAVPASEAAPAPALLGDDDGHGETMVRPSGAGRLPPPVPDPAPFSGEEDFDADSVEPTVMRPLPIAPAGPLKPGDVISGRYEIVAHLAEGGMGEVYRATHVELGRVFALKVMKQELSQDPEFVERFKREAVASSRIGQQNIVDISDFGRTDSGRFYFVMEFLDGPTLAQVIQRERVLYASRAVGILVQIARALAAAHEQGIVHRDLKPENVILLQRAGQKDFVKVVDFGVAKVADASGKGAQTALGVVVGTPQYMSPEQASGLPVDARSDIYSLGLIAWELIAGRTVFEADSVIGVMMAHMKTPAPPLVPGLADSFVPPELAAIIMRMLEKERDARPQTMLEVIEVFEQFLYGALKAGPAVTGARATGAFGAPPAGAPMPEAAPVPAPAPARPRWLLFAIGGVVLTLSLVLLYVVTRPKALPVVTPPPPVVVRPPEPVKPEPVKPPPAVETASIKVITTPEKAEVYDGDILLGVTPFETHWPKKKLLKLRVAKEGFLDETRTMSPEADLELDFDLKKKPVAPKPKPKPAPDDLSDSPY